jgi:hypothetical protein
MQHKHYFVYILTNDALIAAANPQWHDLFGKMHAAEKGGCR